MFSSLFPSYDFAFWWHYTGYRDKELEYTRKKSNQNIHNNAAEIVRLIDYLAGRESGQYIARPPSSFRRNIRSHKFGPTAVADSGDTFQLIGGPQQGPLRISQYPTSPIYGPSVDHRYGTGLSQETVLKIEELKRLVLRYPQYHTNHDEIIKWAIFCSANGDNKFLDEKLEQLRSIDGFRKY
ncbi:MAG: hypothetical protein WAM14_09110 [Candidatus Nitrosopolaris sp.]